MQFNRMPDDLGVRPSIETHEIQDKESDVINKSNSKIKGISEKVFTQIQKTLSRPRTEKTHTKKTDSFQAECKKPDAMFKPSFVAKKIVMKLGNNPAKVRQIIQDLCKGNDPRFNNKLKSVGSFKFNKDKILSEIDRIEHGPSQPTQNKLSEVANKELNPQSSPTESSYTEKEMKMVAMQLVGLVHREDITDSSGICQRACHAETGKDGTITLSEESTSPSAELPKHERDVRTLANTASLTFGSANEKEVLCFRSAKTHKLHLLEQRSKADITSRLEVSEGQLKKAEKGDCINGLTVVGFEADDKPILEYQPLIQTMMDSSLVKSVWTSSQKVIARVRKASKFQFSQAKGTPIEDERKFLTKMKNANSKRFIGQEHIEHKVSIGGKKYTVREKPAIVQNHVFSSQSKFAINRRQARKDNLSGQMNMLKMLAMKGGKVGRDTISSATANLINKAGLKPDKDQLKAITKALGEEYEKAKDEKLKIVLQAFKANLTGSGFEDYSYDQVDSGADLSMLTGIQADFLGLSFSPQCKSGNDRTIVAVAHKLAQRKFLEKYKEYFNPEGSEQLEDYITFFSEAVDQFGLSNVEASRGPVSPDGKSEIKIKSSPAAHKYLPKEWVLKGMIGQSGYMTG